MSVRFEYKILDDKNIEITINGRKKFLLNSKEIVEFKKVLTSAGFDWASRFKCSLDLPECH